jgi:hypothetical protein
MGKTLDERILALQKLKERRVKKQELKAQIERARKELAKLK